MKIGEDFSPIAFDFYNWKLLEPNAFIGDMLIFFLSLYYVSQINKLQKKEAFFSYWKYFYLVFGLGFFAGGLGHLFFNYWGVKGKFPSWILGMLAVTMIEFAMTSLLKNNKLVRNFKFFIVLKLIVFILIETYIAFFTDIENNVQKGLFLPMINTVIGMGIIMTYYSVQFQKTLNENFKYLWMSTLVLIPSALFQVFKVNFAQWFDRNDLSHVFLIIAHVIYFKAISGYGKSTIGSDSQHT